jgi:YHS domain-containing protein
VAPIRILILAVLFYIGYRLLRSSFMKKGSPEDSASSAPGPNERLTDVLVEDPVCKKLVPKEQAVRLDQNGEIFYFCSQECCNEFASEKGDTV